MKPFFKPNSMLRHSVFALVFGIGAAFVIAGSASAQYAPTGNDGVTASPKVRAQLDERKATAKPAATTATIMACPKCKDGWVAVNDSTERGLGARRLAGQAPRTVAIHLCPGCRADWSVTGTGKATQAVAEHQCGGCGAAELACCGKAAGALASKGMGQPVNVAPLK